MALTLTKTHVTYEGDLKVWYGTATGDSSYPTGGEELSLTVLGFARRVVDVSVGLSTATGHVGAWDASTTAPKLLVFYGDYSEASDGVLIQIPNATNIATAVFPLRIAGI